MSAFHDELTSLLPDLNRFARSLTRNEDDAHDLVQDCVERALNKRALFQDGTSLKSWLFTLMRNLFISSKRREAVDRKYVALSQPEAWNVEMPRQTDRVFLKETLRAMKSLSAGERQAIVVLGIHDAPQQAVARICGEPVGTLKSRLSRGRAHLRAQMGLDQMAFA
ncbi:MAG: RNA polymerase sigma factor [Rhodospirillaceae bacterium]|nr:RNA polymerase sigma factor [Rhodospirillaceae bacterium]